MIRKDLTEITGGEINELIRNRKHPMQTVTVDNFSVERDPGEEQLSLKMKFVMVSRLLKEKSSLPKKELVNRLVRLLKE